MTRQLRGLAAAAGLGFAIPAAGAGVSAETPRVRTGKPPVIPAASAGIASVGYPLGESNPCLRTENPVS